MFLQKRTEKIGLPQMCSRPTGMRCSVVRIPDNYMVSREAAIAAPGTFRNHQLILKFMLALVANIFAHHFICCKNTPQCNRSSLACARTHFHVCASAVWTPDRRVNRFPAVWARRRPLRYLFATARALNQCPIPHPNLFNISYFILSYFL